MDGDSAYEQVRRWADSGGVWRVVSRTDERVEIVLLTCDAGEEMGRVTSTEPALLALAARQSGSDVPPAASG